MYAAQYEITLPADYDMGIVRERVADLGHAMDDRAGLALKAYLVRARGVHDSPVNQYAPFYLWNDSGAMSHFLVGGGGFHGIVRDFGRPAVHHWVGLASQPGPARGAPATAASRRLTEIPADRDAAGAGLTDLIRREIDDLHALAGRAGVHTAALAFDPSRWRLMRFALWQDAIPEAEDITERYEVLHLSHPHLWALPDGRHW